MQNAFAVYLEQIMGFQKGKLKCTFLLLNHECLNCILFNFSGMDDLVSKYKNLSYNTQVL